MKLKQLLWALVLLVAPALAQSAPGQNFQWDLVAGATGYNGYCAAVTGVPAASRTKIFTVGTVGTFAATLAPGKYFCVATTLMNTNESAYSNEVVVNVPVPPPGNFRVVITVAINQETGKLEMVVDATQAQ